jgi:hypothetical protein
MIDDIVCIRADRGGWRYTLEKKTVVRDRMVELIPGYVTVYRTEHPPRHHCSLCHIHYDNRTRVSPYSLTSFRR